MDVEKQKIFVGGLNWSTTKEGLIEHFTKYGVVTDAVVMKDSVTKKPRGFGFVTFSDPEGKDLALKDSEHTLDGKKIDPKPAQVKNAQNACGQSQEKNKKIFIGGVAASTTDALIEQAFEGLSLNSQEGMPLSIKVKDVELKRDKATDRNRGFGFVEFEEEEVIDPIIKKHFIEIDGKMVECKRAEPRLGKGEGSPASYPQQYPPPGNSFRFMNCYPPTASFPYQQQQQQQQQPQQYYSGYCYQQPATTGQYASSQYNSGQYASNQYANGADRFAGNQQGSSTQQMSSYNQDAAFASRTTGYSASENYGTQSGFSYDSTSVPTQTSAYQQYGDSPASNYNRPMGQSQQPRSFY